MPLKRLVLVTLDYPPEVGGVARYVSELVQEAAGRMRVVVPEEHQTDGPGHVMALPMFQTQKPVWWPLVRLFRTKIATDEQVLISHVFPVGFAAWIARIFGGPEYSLLFHGLDLKLASSTWKRFLLRLICKRARALFVNSQATANLLQERCAPDNVKSIIITPGIRLREKKEQKQARKKLGLGDEMKIVLTVSRFVPRKGIDVTIQAMAKIQSELSVRYVVIGSGTDRGRLEEMAKTVGVDVMWVSANDEQKWDWFFACDIFCMPSRETADDIEGFGIVYLEAAMAGKPTIAGCSGGAMEAVIDGKTGILVDPTSAEEVAQAIRTLLVDTEQAAKIGKNARERVLSQFDWESRWQIIMQKLI
ncbi:glycosyltransferase family 4 protein [Candidatus Uhrbacteria bacterium]|nr:glycosyltransferase family 4 protein [Candidatus Uhrbacteria bacterium]